MKNSKELSLEIQAAQAKVEAITTIASQENRELTADEAKEVDASIEACKSLSEQRTRAEKVEAFVSARVDKLKASNEDPAPTDRIRIPATARNHGRLKNFKGPDAERDAFVSGQFLAAAFAGNRKSQQWCRDHGIVYDAMGENDDSKGGVLVPPEFSSTIIRLVEEYGVFGRYARNYPMTSDTVSIPRRVGGVTAYAVGENSEIQASDASLGQVNLTARKWGTLQRMSTELSEDAAVSIADFLVQEIAYAHAVKQDQAGFLGDGTTTYHGIMGLANALLAGSVSTATVGNTDATLTIAAFNSAVAKLPQFPGISPVWFVNSAVYWNVMARLQLAAGGNNVADLGNGPVMQFLGYPVVFSQALPTSVGSSTKFAYFGDLGMACTLGNRRRVTIKSDASRYIEFDQLALVSTLRYDINVHEVGTASVAGPVIQLVSAS